MKDIIIQIAVTCFVLLFVIIELYEEGFENGVKKGYSKARKPKGEMIDLQEIIKRYELIEDKCREQSRSLEITKDESRYLVYRADCYRDIISDLKKGIHDGIS